MQNAKPEEQKHQINLGLLLMGTFLLGICLVLVIQHNPDPSGPEFWVLRIFASLGAAFLGTGIPGLLSIELSAGIRATGALAIFVIVFLVNPSRLWVMHRRLIDQPLRLSRPSFPRAIPLTLSSLSTGRFLNPPAAHQVCREK